MTFPKRWLDDDGDATSSVRNVLRSGRSMDPPEGAENAVWLGLMGQIGAAGVGGAAAGASGKAAAAASAGGAKAAAAAGAGTSAGGATGGAIAGAMGGGLFKAILIGAFSGIVAVSGYSALAPAQDPTSPTSPSAPLTTPSAAAAAPPSPDRPAAERQATPAAPPSVAPGSAPAAAAPAATEARDPAQSASPSAVSAGDEPSGAAAPPPADSAAAAAAPLPGSAEERASRLREESEMLGQARAALRGGDTGGAMRLLEQARSKFPGGVLGQEREALTIETLAKSGAREVASGRAAAFIKAHPQSPHAARLQAFVQP